MTNINYITNGKTYILTQSAGINCPELDFGKWKAYGRGKHEDKCFIEANGPDLIIHEGYEWDGCTGVPTGDWNVRASLVHDALYQSKKCGADTISWYAIDSIFRTMMLQDGASWFQRNVYYYGVKTFGFFFKCSKLNSLKIVKK